MTNPPISVIVVTYMREQVLCDTLLHLLDQDYPNWELIVVDQTLEHEPNTVEFLQRVSHRLRYIEIDKVGMCHARNVGIEAAQGKIVIFADDDIVPGSGLLALHARHFDDRRIGGVTGPIHFQPLPTDGPVQLQPGGAIHREQFPDTVVQTETVHGGNMSFRKADLLTVGGFDEGYILRAHREETDISLRVRALGLDLLYDPSARVHHLAFPTGGSRATQSEEKRYIFGWYHNNAYFFGKHMPVWQLPLFLRYQLGPLLYRNAWKQKRVDLLSPGFAGLRDGYLQGRKARRRMTALRPVIR